MRIPRPLEIVLKVSGVLALAGLAILFLVVGLETADKLASTLSPFFTVLAILAGNRTASAIGSASGDRREPADEDGPPPPPGGSRRWPTAIWTVVAVAFIVGGAIGIYVLARDSEPPTVASPSSSCGGEDPGSAAPQPGKFPAFKAYHGYTSAQQAARAHDLIEAGYKPITVSHSTGGLHAAVWVRASGAFCIYQDMSADEYQTRFDQLAAKGYQPVSVGATGSGSGARFDAIWHKRSGAFQARFGLTTAGLESADAAAASAGLGVAAIEVYGTADSPRYAVIWQPGRTSLVIGLRQAQHSAEFNRRWNGGQHPVAVAIGPDGETYTSAWTATDIGDWREYTGMSAEQYTDRVDELKAEGFYPFSVNSEAGNYAAIWRVRFP